MTINNKIDLNTCVPGQNLERRDGTLVSYERKATFSLNKKLFNIDYPHLIDGESYTDDGHYRVSRTEDSWDIVKILPLKEPKTKIDLNTCVPGQKVRLRSGRVNYYTGPIKDGYGRRCAHQINGDIYMNNGCYWEDYRESELDVVEILPIGDKPVTDLRTCVPGQKLRLRDGRIATYKRTTDSYEYPHQVYSGGTYTDEGYYWLDKGRSQGDVMEILPLEEEPAKTSTELTHSITDQIDVTSPDHVSIIPQSNGVLISIKKGLTTISWRHYNH